MSNKFDLEERIIVFAAVIVDFAETISQSVLNDYLANQILRSSGSPTLNFGKM